MGDGSNVRCNDWLCLNLIQNCLSEFFNGRNPAVNCCYPDRRDLMPATPRSLIVAISSMNDLMPPFHDQLDS